MSIKSFEHRSSLPLSFFVTLGKFDVRYKKILTHLVATISLESECFVWTGGSTPTTLQTVSLTVFYKLEKCYVSCGFGHLEITIRVKTKLPNLSISLTLSQHETVSVSRNVVFQNNPKTSNRNSSLRPRQYNLKVRLRRTIRHTPGLCDCVRTTALLGDFLYLDQKGVLFRTLDILVPYLKNFFTRSLCLIEIYMYKYI